MIWLVQFKRGRTLSKKLVYKFVREKGEMIRSIDHEARGKRMEKGPRAKRLETVND